MTEEEHALFPRIEKALAEQASEAPKAPGSCLYESMTVNRVIHDFPKTRETLKELFVNIPIEGCHCLDEVAWRHGIGTSELLRMLEGAISSRSRQSKERDKSESSVQGVNAA